MIRGKLLAMLIAAPLIASGLAQAADVKPPSQPTVETRETINARLDQVLPEVTFDGVGFSDVVDFLGDVSGANIVVQWKALEAAGIDKNAPVTIKAKNIHFRTGLQVILNNVGGSATNLAYTVDDGIITISTQEDNAKNLVLRSYDVTTLVDPPGQGASVILPTRTEPSADPVSTRSARVAELIKFISDSVAPDSWRDNGGSIGSIREHDGVLFICQTEETQKAIQTLLVGLRSQALRQYAVRVRLVTMTPEEMEKIAPATTGGGPRRVDFSAGNAANREQLVSEVTCLANQRIAIAAGDARTVVTHVTTRTPADSTDKSAAADSTDSATVAKPQEQRDADSQLMQDGFCLDLLAQYVTDDEVKLDIGAVRGKWKDASDANPGAPGDPDRVEAAMDNLHTVARLPLNQAVLLASIPLTKPDPHGQTVNLYMIVEVSMSPPPKSPNAK